MKKETMVCPEIRINAGRATIVHFDEYGQCRDILLTQDLHSRLRTYSVIKNLRWSVVAVHAERRTRRHAENTEA